MKAMLVNIFTAQKLRSFLTLILFLGLSQSLLAASTWYADPTGVTVAIISGNGASSSGLSTSSSGPFTGTAQTVGTADVIVVQSGSKINVNASAQVVGILFTGGQLNMNVSGVTLSTGYCAGDVNGTTVGTGYFTYTTSLTFANRGRISLNSASATTSTPKVLWVNLTNSAPSIGATATSVDGYFSIYSNVKLGGNTTTNGRMLIGNSGASTVYSLNLNGYTLSCDYYQGYTLNSGNRISNTYGSLAAVSGGGSSPSITLTNASGTNNASTLYMDQTSVGTTDNVAITMNNAGGLTLYSNATLSGLTLTTGIIYLNGNTVNGATFPSGSSTSYLASGSSSAAGGGYAKITSPSTNGTPTVVPIGTYNTYLPISFANTSTSPSTPSFTVGVSPITSSYLYLSSASSSSTTVTCASTANLAVGSTVTVVGGTGVFAANTTVATITSATQFTVSSTPTTALLAGASILATSTVASVANLSLSSASGSGTTITCTSTANLTVGTTVTVTGGTGAFATNTTVLTVLSATQFTVSQTPSTGLSGATVLATSIPNVANSSNCVPFVWSIQSTVSGSTSSIVFQSASNSQGLTGSPSQVGFATSGTSSISGIQSVSGTTTSNPYTATLNGYTLPANTTANTFYIGNAISDLSAAAVTYYTNNNTVVMNGNAITSGTLYTAPNGGGIANTTSINTIDNIIVENGGTLTFGTSAATFGYVTVNSGGTLNVNIGLTTATNLTVAGTATSNSSGIIAGGVVVRNGGTLTTSAAISSGGINVNNGGTANIGASITGGTSIAGTLYVTVVSVSLGAINLTGILNVNAGTSSTAVTTSSDLTIGSGATLNIGPSSTGYFSITGNLLMTGGTLSVSTNSTITLTKNLAGSADGTTTQATGTLSGAGSIYFNGGGLGTGGSVNITSGVATIGTSPNPQLLYADFHASSGFTGPVTMLTYVKLGGNTILPCRLKNGSPTITSVLALNGFSLTCTQYYLGNTSSPYNVLTGGGNSSLILTGASTNSTLFMDQNTTNSASATNALNLTMNTTGTSYMILYNNLYLANSGSNPSSLTSGIVYLNGQTVSAATFPTANSSSFFAEGISGNAATGGSLIITSPSTNSTATIVPIGTYNSGAVYTPVSFANTTGAPTSFTVSVSTLISTNLSGGTSNSLPYQWNITTIGGASPTATLAFQSPTVNTGFTTSGGSTAQLGVLVNGTTGYANVVTTSTASPAYLTSMSISGAGPYIATTPSSYALYNNSLANTYVIANTGSVFPLPTITSAVTASTNAANVYSYTITGANIGTLNATNLPSGISFSSPTISGTPSVTVSGVTNNITLTNTNIAGVVTKNLALTITVSTWYADPTGTNIAIIDNGSGSSALSSGWSSSPSGGDYTAINQVIGAGDIIVVQAGSKINVNGTSQITGIVFSGGQLNMNVASVILSTGFCAGDVNGTTVGTGYFTYTTSVGSSLKGRIALNSASATTSNPKSLGVNFTNSAPSIGGVPTSVNGYISIYSNVKLVGNTTTNGKMLIANGASATTYSLNLNGYILSCDYYSGYTTFSGSRVSNTYGSLAAVSGGGSTPGIILNGNSGSNVSTLYMDQTSVGTTDKVALTINNAGGLTLYSNLTLGGLTLTNGLISMGNYSIFGDASVFSAGSSASYLSESGTGTVTVNSLSNAVVTIPIGTTGTNYLPVSFANTTLSPSFTVGVSSLTAANVYTSASCIPYQWNITSSVQNPQSDITFYSTSSTGITSTSQLGVLTATQLSGGYTSMTTNLATANAIGNYFTTFTGYTLPANTTTNTFVIGTNGSVFPLPTITSTLTASIIASNAYSYTILGANIGTLNATNLPSGLSFSSPTISGTPSVTSSGVANINLTNTNIAGVATKTLVLTINVTKWYSDPTATNVAILNNGSGSTASSSGWSSSPSGGNYTATGQTISASDTIVVQAGSQINVTGASQVGSIIFSGGQLNMATTSVLSCGGNCSGDANGTTVGTGYFTYTTSLGSKGRISINSGSATINTPKVLWVNFSNSAPAIAGVPTSVDGYFSIFSNVKLGGNTTTYGRMLIGNSGSATLFSLNLNGYSLACDYYQGYTTNAGNRVSNTYGSLESVTGGGSSPSINLMGTTGSNASTLYMDQTSVGTTDKVGITMNNAGGLTLYSNVTLGGLTLTNGIINMGNFSITGDATAFSTGSSSSYLSESGTGKVTVNSLSNSVVTIPIGTTGTNYLPISFANTTLSPSYTVGVAALSAANVFTSASCIPYQWNITSSLASSQSDITFYSTSATGIATNSQLGVLTTSQLSGGYASMNINLATASAFGNHYVSFSGYTLPANITSNTFVIGTNGSVFPLPTITSANSDNSGSSQYYTYTITGAHSGTFNATNLPAGLSFSSPTISGTPSGTGLTDIVLTNTNIAGVATQNLALTIQPSNTTWNGTTWTGGVPDYTQNATIAANLTFSTSLSCNNLTVNSNVNVVNNGTLTVKGATIINNGTISGTGTTLLNGSTAQTISGNGVVANLTVNNSHNLSITSGINNLGVTGVLTLTAGVLTTNGNLTLKSTSIANSGILAPYGVSGNTGTISGNVTVERFIPKGFRAYRDISSGGVYSATNYLFNTWQESGSYANTGYGMFITGILDTIVRHNLVDATYGIDHSLTGNASAFYYRAGWDTVKNTKTELLNPYQAYRVLVRGDRSFDLDTSGVVMVTGPTQLAMNAATTLRATGSLITGTVTYTTSGVSNGVYTNSIGLNAASNGYTYVANPYAAPIDFHNIYISGRLTNIDPRYYYLDPTMGSTGSYVSYNAVSNTSSNNATYGQFIQAGQGFLIGNTSSSPQLQITEADKSILSTSRTSVFGATTPNSKMAFTLLKQGGGATAKMDGAVAVFGTQFSNAIGVEDNVKMSNAADNLSILEGTKSLSIDGRLPAIANDVLVINIGSLSGTTYQLEIDATAYTANGLTAYLHDAYKNTTTALAAGINTISFTADAKVAATYQNRFSIVFKPTTLAVNSFVASAKVNGTIATINWNTVGENGVTSYEVEKSNDGTLFTAIAQQVAKNTATASYTATDDKVTVTTYYRIKAISTDGTITYSNIAKLSTNNSPLTTIYPNPLTGNTFNVQLGNVVAGKYVVSITNALGQKVAESTIAHAGGNGTHSVNIESSIAKGVYNVLITSVDSKQLIYQTNLSVQ